MIKDLRVKQVSWFGGLLKWDYTDCENTAVVLLERTADKSKSVVHYRGKKRQCKVVGLSPNTKYTFTLQTDKRSENEPSRDNRGSCKQDSKPNIPEIKIDYCENQDQDGTEQNGAKGPDEKTENHDEAKTVTDDTTSNNKTFDQVIPNSEPLESTTRKDESRAAEEDSQDGSDGVVTELEVTFRTEKCGKHDARLIAAIENHDMNLVRKICEQSPEVISIPDRTGVTPLMIAAIRGYPSIIRVLLEAGANLDQPNPGGKTALMLAAYHGHTHVITTLMELGCDWQRMDHAGCTALHYTVERGNIEIAETLLRTGADINMGDSRGYTCLLSLCLNDREDVAMAKFLLDNGADPNLNLQKGESILMAAARTNKPDLTRLLLQYGASVKTKTRYGYTALDMAKQGSECYDIISQCPIEESDSEKEDDDFSSWMSKNAR